MNFSRKEREKKQKNWRMWKKGKQWICGAAMLFTVLASPGMIVLADEVNSIESTTVIAGNDATSSLEIMDSSKQEENTGKNSETKVGVGKKERPKQGRIITQPTAINVVFPDANLAEGIRAKLGKSSVSDLVTQSELNTITEFNDWENGDQIWVNGVTNLSGIEHLINLTYLTGISNGQISDISALSGLTNLKYLSLSGNQISDISALSGLTNLKYLDLNSNQISDVSPLAGLTNLTTYLGLMRNQISDISALSGLINLRKLHLDRNQISDISPVSGMTRLLHLNADYNQISDISSLSSLGLLHSTSDDGDDDNESTLAVRNQQITLSGINWSNPLEVPFIVEDTDYHDEITPSSISNNGQFADGIITWNGLLNNSQELTYSWNRVSDVSDASPGFSYYHVFSGTVTVHVEPVSIPAVKILVDADGSSQTTGDQTLFAEEADENWDSAEDAYNYAKEQLNGTGYGLMSIEIDSHGNRVILVSRVGALKKVNTNGTAVETDVPYTPTYTVTGTGDDAELVVSYEVSMDTPSTGYVYVYGKNTAQEVRYTTGRLITISRTDTNGNGVPQWKENYTAVQYQRAGALHPITPDGSQVPGGTIFIPEDAIEGDIITVPDTITGSNGRDYGVDSTIDVNPNTPGIQFTLTEYAQDVLYFDTPLSESESGSLSGSESESTTTGMNASETDVANVQNGNSVGLTSAQNEKLVKTGDVSMLSLQGVGAGLLASLSGLWVWVRRKKKA
ncbi:leucine-rich repeat domain-containing protein [Listeria monocytogenes]|nr:leucine-rich repeat domain-containing protein [Listeria monocytogenes]HAO6016025.1 LPXTG cell wall anchor domain-containing protein [Listeria monocytogenes]